MRTCITGGAGFIGRHVTDVLLARGEEVRVLDLAPEGMPAGVEAMAGSVTEPADLARAVEGCDAVIHLAANPHLWADDPTVFERVNHQGTRNMLAACRAADVSRIVHVSSLTVLVGGRAGGPAYRVDEDLLLPERAMLGAYPLSKWRAEAAAMEAARDGLPVSVALPTMPVGPGDAHLTGPTKMVLDYVRGKTPASVSCWMNLCDVRDLAAGLVAIREEGGVGERYILGGEDIAMSALLDHLQEVSGVPMPRATVPGWVASLAGWVDEWMADHVTHQPPKAPLTGVRLSRRPVLFDSGKAQREFGFEVRPLEESLRDLLTWFEAEGLWRHPRAG